MTPVLQIGNRTVTATEIVKLLSSYQMLPQLCREIIIDQAIVAIKLSAEEKNNAIEQFYQKLHLTALEASQVALKHYGMSGEQLETLATRELRIEKFKQATWSSKTESYFLSHKSQLDKVIYSLLRTQDAEVAQELYFRIKAGEQSFAECASKYSQGIEAQTGGIVGPVPLSQPHPAIAQKLAISQLGQLWPPMRLENWVLIVRLEKLIPAQLDDVTRSTLVNHLFEQWLAQQINNIQLLVHNEWH